jgi:hypothetical protein
MTTSWDPPSRDQLLKLGHEIWGLGRGDGPLTARATTVSQAQVPAVYGCSMHALEAGDAALGLIKQGRELIAMTLIRSALESAMTSMWLVQSRESIFGFVAEEHRQRRAISKQLAQSVNPVMRQVSQTVAHIDEALIETVAAPQAQYFNRLCGSLEGGDEGYVHYRILSGMVHPSATLTDFYVDVDEDAPGVVASSWILSR